MSGPPIRLVEVVTHLSIGGTERQLLDLVQGLEHSRFDVHLACLKPGGTWAPQFAKHARLRNYQISRLYGPRAWRQQVRFAADLRRERADVVHAQGFYPTVFAVPVARLSGARAIASVRDQGDILTHPQRRVLRVICRLAHCIVVNAEIVKQRLIREGLGDKDIRVIHNGVDLTRFADTRPRPELRASLGIPANVPVVAVIARIEPVKGIDCFLQAAALLRRDFPETRFLIVGDSWSPPNHGVDSGSYRRKLEHLGLRLGLDGRVIFTGFRTDVDALLREVTVSAVASRSEALCNALLEAMAAGVPSVATAVGGNPEVIEDGVSGLLVPPDNPQALAAALRRVLSDRSLAARLGAAGRARVHQSFSRDRMVRDTEQLYLELARRKCAA